MTSRRDGIHRRNGGTNIHARRIKTREAEQMHHIVASNICFVAAVEYWRGILTCTARGDKEA